MKTTLFIAAILLLASAVSYGEDQEKHSEKADKAAKRQRERILAEIQNLGPHDWAGDYYAGDGLGVNITLSLAPTSGYVFEWHGCLGLYDRNYGTVAWINGCVCLSFTFENARKGF